LGTIEQFAMVSVILEITIPAWAAGFSPRSARRTRRFWSIKLRTSCSSCTSWWVLSF